MVNGPRRFRSRSPHNKGRSCHSRLPPLSKRSRLGHPASWSGDSSLSSSPDPFLRGEALQCLEALLDHRLLEFVFLSSSIGSPPAYECLEAGLPAVESHPTIFQSCTWNAREKFGYEKWELSPVVAPRPALRGGRGRTPLELVANSLTRVFASDAIPLPIGPQADNWDDPGGHPGQGSSDRLRLLTRPLAERLSDLAVVEMSLGRQIALPIPFGNAKGECRWLSDRGPISTK